MSRHTVLLTIASLLSILFATFHLADDIVRGFAPGGLTNITFIAITVVWLYGTVVLASILGSGVPVIHMTRAGLVGGRIAHTNGMFFWVWTMLSLGMTSVFSVILAARGLWSLPWRRQT